jgi:ubiquinone/menaquinone biosynthesis C-methylase UbiE
MGDPEIKRLSRIFGESGAVPLEGGKWNDERPGNQAIFSERTSRMKGLLDEADISLEGLRILEVGCGAGRTTYLLNALGANTEQIWGVDLFRRPLQYFRTNHAEAHLSQQNGAQLAFAPASFDCVVLFTVMSSIEDEEMRRQVVSETLRVLKPGGFVLWYELRYRNPRNQDVHGLNRDAIENLFPEFERRLQSATLLPPLARRLGPRGATLYSLLASIPLLRTHYVGLFRVKPLDSEA